VSRDLFEDVQRKLSMHVKENQKHDYIFSGLMRCAVCGRSMAGMQDSHLRGGKRIRRPMYRCTSYYQYGVRRCTNSHTIMETTVEKFLIENIKALAEVTLAGYELEDAPQKDNRAKIAGIRRKMDRLKDLYVNELISIEQYKTDLGKYTADITALEADQPEQRDTSALDALLHIDLGAVYSQMTNKEKRYFWRALLKEIRFDASKNLEPVPL
jgi:hypothetical protein